MKPSLTERGRPTIVLGEREELLLQQACELCDKLSAMADEQLHDYGPALWDHYKVIGNIISLAGSVSVDLCELLLELNGERGTELTENEKKSFLPPDYDHDMPF